jgi:hypothetical protein
MAYVKEIKRINDDVRQLLIFKYRTEPIKINNDCLTAFDHQYLYSKISYEIFDDGSGTNRSVVALYDAKVIHPLLPGDIGQIRDAVGSSFKTVFVNKKLQEQLHHCLQKGRRLVCFELCTDGKLSHWIVIENKIRFLDVSRDFSWLKDLVREL